MKTRIKTDGEINAMRESGRMLATVHKVLAENIAEGMSTKDLDNIARKELKSLGGQPAFLGQYGFPETLCTSVNDEIVHGIPKPDKILSDGDLVSMDYGVIYKGMTTDSALTVVVGNATKPKLQLLETTRDALSAGIGVLCDGVKVGDIGAAVQAVIESKHYGVVRDLVGHGVGHELHEDPNIPNYGTPGRGEELSAGMTIAIEPMVTLGSPEVKLGEDQWTVKTADGSLSAHFEHTVLITDDGAEILTQL